MVYAGARGFEITSVNGGKALLIQELLETIPIKFGENECFGDHGVADRAPFPAHWPA